MDRPRPPRFVRIAVISAVVALTVLGLVTTALTPRLAPTHPLLLIALEAPLRNMLLAQRVPLWQLVLVATLRRGSAATLYYLLGRWYGDVAVRWLERKLGRGGAVVRTVERGFSVAALPMVFFLPVPLVCVLAGATGIHAAVFLVVSVAGSATVALLVRLLGNTFAAEVHAVLTYLEHNVLPATAAVVVLIALSLIWKRLRGGESLESIKEVERDLHDE